MNLLYVGETGANTTATRTWRVGALELQHTKCCQLQVKLLQCTAAAAATGADTEEHLCTAGQSTSEDLMTADDVGLTL